MPYCGHLTGANHERSIAINGHIVLRAVNLPPVGGDTIWVDAGLAYQQMPDALKQRLEGLHVTHDYRPALNKVGQDYPILAHPVVRLHRETGEKILWVISARTPS
jgi:alpha-ketoglutarate-dependent taurine dioxygenase